MLQPRSFFEKIALMMALVLVTFLHGCKSPQSAAGRAAVWSPQLLQVCHASPQASQLYMIPVQGPGGQTYYVSEMTVVDASHVARATRYTTRDGHPAVRVMLNEEGQQRMLAAAEHYVGNHLAMFVRSELVSVPVVRDPVQQLIILRYDPPFTEAEVDDLINALNTR